VQTHAGAGRGAADSLDGPIQKSQPSRIARLAETLPPRSLDETSAPLAAGGPPGHSDELSPGAAPRERGVLTRLSEGPTTNPAAPAHRREADRASCLHACRNETRGRPGAVHGAKSARRRSGIRSSRGGTEERQARRADCDADWSAVRAPDHVPPIAAVEASRATTSSRRAATCSRPIPG